MVRPLLLAVALIVTGSVGVASAQVRAGEGDSIEVGLLTCSAGQKVYSLYGHTAIRYHDLRTGDDWTFNYGVFNVNKPHFVLRFLFGLTDYELGVLPMDIFVEEYRREGRAVTEQVLNMTAEEKRRLWDELAVNFRPENRVYRYNYFYDNCTTRARDMIELAFGGRLAYAHAGENGADGLSYRSLVRAHAAGHPWAAFGNDLCLGLKADRPTDWRQRQFLPEELMGDMDKATVSDGGSECPAVLQTRTVVKGVPQTVASEFPLSPLACALSLLVVTLVVCGVEWKAKRWLRFYDVLLMLAQGVAGIVVVALLFSEHPTTSTNLTALLLNPLPLLFLYSVVRGRPTHWWRLSVALSVLFLAGAAVQCYAEGMVVVALSLLLRGVLGEVRQRHRRIK